MNVAVICRILGVALEVEAAFMAPALGISLYKNEWGAVAGFSATMALLLLCGVILRRIKVTRTEYYAREGFVTVGLTWLVLSLFGALPLYMSHAVPSYVDCFFEIVSGFTTTGASVIAAVEDLPMGILYWRSFTNWLGGMGVLVFVLSVSNITDNSGDALHLLRAESPGVKVGKLVPRMQRSTKILYMIYIAISVLMFLLLVVDMPVFDALTAVFATGGTGGFSVKNLGMAVYSTYSQIVMTVFMLLFSVNFTVYYLILVRRFRTAFRNEELWTFAGVYAACVAVITWNILPQCESLSTALHHSSFTVASIISTTGFSITDFDLWPWLSKTVLVILMFCGACAGSTGGGVKVVRVVLMFKYIKRGVRRAIHPKEVDIIHMDGEVVEDETMDSVAVFLLVYLVLFIGMLLLLALEGLDFTTTFSGLAACLNNIGPALGKAGPALNYNCFSWFGKIILSFAMLFGRLEVYPMLMLFIPSAWKK
ncbi:MAG: TrkH family potassium uptake protein [Oscillospiraceae bacterium]|nr:TrkH family potassium uptake protein [Oscillospiraceae bacterium]